MKPISFLATVIFALAAVAHLLRLVFGVEVIIGGIHIPVWFSGIGFVATAALSILLFLEQKKNCIH